VAEVLTIYGRYYPRRRPVGELVGLVGLTGKERERVKLLPGGRRRRLDLALALVGDPDVLFLDEPTTGFDPSARRQAWTTIKDLCALGKTVFLTTHYMDEAQALADRVAVMVDGRIVALGTPAEIGGRDTAPTEITFALPDGVGVGDLPAFDGGRADEPAPGRVRLVTTDGLRTAHAITGWAIERGHELRGFAVSQPSLEDVYLRLTDDREAARR
jgi:ABC-2 type transport system ATP-binding protein